MTEDGWARGMAELLTLPERDESPERKAIKGVTYRRELDGLTDELWLAAVRIALQRDKWFPPVASLLEYASEAAGTLPRWNALPEDTRSIAEKRADARRGFEIFRDELRRLGAVIPDEPVRSIE